MLPGFLSSRAGATWDISTSRPFLLAGSRSGAAEVQHAHRRTQNMGCPRMFYHAFAALPEWAPLREDHILYSYGVLTSVQYAHGGEVLAAGVAAADRKSVARSCVRPPGKGVAYGFPAMENGHEAQRIRVGARRGGMQ